MSADITHDKVRSHLPSAGRHTPVSTYRLQLGPGMTFDDAITTLGYIDDLGATDVYVSPILQAAPGSTHGYDVVDHSQISAELGGRTAFERFADAVHDHQMSLVVDVVPNHMGVPTPIYHNKALWSVLKEGPQSPYASWFDGTADGAEGMLMPFLGKRIGTVLADGELELVDEVIPGFENIGPQPVLKYFDHRFPVRAGTETLPLHLCVAEQYYRLAYWKVGAEEVNFRRFFDVDTLLALRVEDDEVFNATHALLFELFHSGHIDAFRIDHPDGLADPRGYMRRLSAATGGSWIAAEKIVEADEQPPADWPIAGLTGYDASWRIDALQVEPSGFAELGSVAYDIAGDMPGTYDDVVRDSKSEVVMSSLIAEVHRIASIAYEICSEDIMLRDHTQGWIAECVAELVIAFPRYRAYVVPGEPAPEESVTLIEEAADEARRHLAPDLYDTLDVVVDLVLGREVGSQSRAGRDKRDEFVVRFQQVCGAVTAKGVEDTTFYRWSQLTALNEVGGNPTSGGIHTDDFHEWMAHMAKAWPATMTGSTTHDSKRSEDVRQRIAVLSQFSSEWKGVVASLHECVEGIRGRTENILWQTLVGTWTDDGPIEVERLCDYMLKASREQKDWTSWTTQDTEAEQHLVDTIRGLYSNDAVMGTLTDWYELTRDAVRTSILSSKAITLTCLGVTDNYQSCETTQNYLVDPDNRQPVDFDSLADMAAELDSRAPRTLAEEKFHLTRQILRLRRRRRTAFVGEKALYKPLPSSTSNVVAFSRGATPEIVTIASLNHRSSAHRLDEHTVVIPDGQWTDVLTNRTYAGGSIALAALLDRFPVAVLEETSFGDQTTTMRAVVAGQSEPPTRPAIPAADDTPGLLGWLTRRFADASDSANGGSRG